ncbi:hypothetical protein [Oryzifoliimicrobium ureilyticus]|uniref:hypothetical protein n=1 Tax=Oryzifoliimicrobium ureilyticus TaxID=3113724 RepID=UPI0030760D91
MDEFQTERDLLRRIRTEGILAAYEAALDVCRDKKAPAPARATASGVLFRVAGLFNPAKDEAARKEAHEMTAAEISAEIKRLGGDFQAKTPGIFD